MDTNLEQEVIVENLVTPALKDLKLETQPFIVDEDFHISQSDVPCTVIEVCERNESV